MGKATYIYAGNRFFVLERMLQHGLNIVAIYAVPDSYLHRALDERGMSGILIESKRQLVESLQQSKFDIFVSNGLPYILPATKIKEATGARLINVHPSYLPDLRGPDPVRGALLFGRRSGATCHHMDDGVDTGEIIARIAIENTPDIDCGLLYQLCFQAEVKVFEMALQRNFKSCHVQAEDDSNIYYTVQTKDREIDWGTDGETILRQIRAFGTRSQGARFTYAGLEVKIFDAEWVTNPFLLERLNDYQENEVVFSYEGCLLVRKGTAFIKLKQICGDVSAIRPGTLLG